MQRWFQEKNIAVSSFFPEIEISMNESWKWGWRQGSFTSEPKLFNRDSSFFITRLIKLISLSVFFSVWLFQQLRMTGSVWTQSIWCFTIWHSRSDDHVLFGQSVRLIKFFLYSGLWYHDGSLSWNHYVYLGNRGVLIEVTYLIKWRVSRAEHRGHVFRGVQLSPGVPQSGFRMNWCSTAQEHQRSDLLHANTPTSTSGPDLLEMQAACEPHEDVKLVQTSAPGCSEDEYSPIQLISSTAAC